MEGIDLLRAQHVGAKFHGVVLAHHNDHGRAPGAQSRHQAPARLLRPLGREAQSACPQTMNEPPQPTRHRPIQDLRARGVKEGEERHFVAR